MGNAGLLILTTIQLITWQCSFAQNVKTYSGEYSDNNIPGTAVYQYYENNSYERIYNGSFKYTQNNKEYYYYGSTVIGQFKDNKKNGMWEWKTIKRNDLTGKIKFFEVVKGKYVDGMLEGLWTYKKIENGTNKILGQSTVTFKNGILVGKYEYDDGFKVLGNFDDDGNRLGDWVISYKTNQGEMIEIKYKYENGNIFPIWTLKRNLANGDVLANNFKDYRDDYYTLDDNNILDFWITDDRNSEYGRRYYSQDYPNPIFELIIRGSIPYAACKQIMANVNSYKNFVKKGDIALNSKNYNEAINNYESALSINDVQSVKEQLSRAYALNSEQLNREFSLKKEQEYQDLIAKGNNAFNIKKYSDAIELFKNAIEIKDEQYPKDKIKEAQLKIEANEISYKNYIAKADIAFKDKRYQKAIENYKNALNIKKEEYPQNQIEVALRLKEEERILNVFLTERLKTIYDISKEDNLLYTSLTKKIQECFLNNNLRDSKSENIEISGNLLLTLDTNGVIIFDFSQVKCEDNIFF